MEMHALITGVSGFVGSHLASYLHGQNWRVSGLDMRAGGKVDQFYKVELADHVSVLDVLKDSKPDVIFHLAGLIKSVDFQALYRANLLGTVAFFDSIVESGLLPKVVLASSSAVYGLGSGPKPVGEKMAIRPVTHYAISKAAQELACLRYVDTCRLPVRIVRMFNLIGPGQSPELALSSFAHQIALAEKYDRNEILTGNLDGFRDFVDVRDAVKAFHLVADSGVDGQAYNVCSGRAVSLQQCLDEMLSMTLRPISSQMDADRIQKHDLSIQVGSYRKLNRITGWQPRITLRQSLGDLLNDWRERVKSEAEIS